MKGVAAGLKVGVTVLATLAIGYGSFKFVSKGMGRDEGYSVWMHFQDATGLMEKTRVQIAGLTIGEVVERRLDGSRARVVIKLRPDAELWSNAVLYKKSASLLGEYYLEIDPGSRYSPDALTGKNRENYLLRGCQAKTGRADCAQIANVIEAVTTNTVMVQISETLPLLRDILDNVRKMTEGPLQDVVKDVHKDADAVAKLIQHVDQIAVDVRGFTNGEASDDIRKSMSNVRDITESIKNLVGSGEGQMNTTGDKLKRDLDKLATALDKLNTTLDHANKVAADVADITDRTSKGEGTVGRLLKDDAIAENLTEVTEDTAGFLRQLTRLQTIVSVREEYNILASSFKTYLSIKLSPRPDKFYLVEVIDDPRGSRSYGHELKTETINGQVVTTNTDLWSRTPAFRFSFMIGKRIEPWGAFGLTGRMGVKESTGGVGVDLDFWKKRLLLQIDVFDLASDLWPRLKIVAAVELFKYLWLLAGVDDALNRSTEGHGPDGITCGPSSPTSWCRGGRDYFVGVQLTFNDEDLRALLTIGAGALSGVATSGAAR